jgi:hypothetical protein
MALPSTYSPSTPQSIPQSNYQSTQNNDPDILGMFKDFVTGGATPNDNEPGENIGIDDIRGRISVSVTGTNTAAIIAVLNINPSANTIAQTPNTTTPVLLAQESRCHAFYRIIGFPVVATNKQFYNPGLDIIKQVDSSGAPITRTVTLANKIIIAQAVGTQFEQISQARETFSSSMTTIFSNASSVEAGVLSLTSGTYDGTTYILRNFASPFIKNTGTNAFDFTISDQSYAINSQSYLVGSKSVPLSLLQDVNANSLTSNNDNTNTFFNHQHIIVPFMVDPRIDFSIWSNDSHTSVGTCRRVAVPFVPDATFLQAGSTSRAIRPLIEKIITDRMSQYSASIDAGQEASSNIQYVQNIKSIQQVQFGSTTVGNIFSGSVFNVSQQDLFVQYVMTIQSMMSKLRDCLKVVAEKQGKYYFLPIPSTNGPEAGGSLRDVPLNQNILPSLITPNDLNIIINQLNTYFSNLNTGVTSANAVPDRGSYAFFGGARYGMTFGSDTSQSLGNLSGNTMDTLSNRRTADLNKAIDNLQIIEMIMGEYSGLGLIDIVSIVGALYVMPIADLFGFLDADAYARAGIILNQSLPAQSDITTSMNDLASYVNGFYQIAQDIFNDYIGNNALNQ